MTMTQNAVVPTRETGEEISPPPGGLRYLAIQSEHEICRELPSRRKSNLQLLVQEPNILPARPNCYRLQLSSRYGRV